MSKYDPACSIIKIDTLLNARDLGGMPTRYGTFPYGVFVRSGTLSESSPEALKKLKEYGVSDVIDLRSRAELLKYGNPAQDDGDLIFHSIPLFLGDPDLDEDPTMTFLRTHHLGDFYVNILEELGSAIAEVMTVLAEAKGIVLFHCAHGKDRTGIISALLYLLAGAEREDIIVNYSFSYDYISWFLDPLIEAREEELKHTLRSDRINMEIMLDHLSQNYDSVTDYLDHAGLSRETIDKIMDKISVTSSSRR